MVVVAGGEQLNSDVEKFYLPISVYNNLLHTIYEFSAMPHPHILLLSFIFLHFQTWKK